MKYQDKSEYMTRLDKKQFIQSIPEILKDHAETHSIFFATFTFKIQRRKTSRHDVFKEYFKALRLKLDKSLLTNSEQYQNRPILLLFPEMSKAHTPDHLHGFLFIHNSTTKKFHKNCVEKVTKEPVPKLDDAIRDNIVLKKFLLDANTLKAPKTFRNQMTYRNEVTRLHIYRDIPAKDRTLHIKEVLAYADSLLVIDNHRLYPITDIQEFQKTSYYSAKNFVSNAADYILEMKDAPKSHKK